MPKLGIGGSGVDMTVVNDIHDDVAAVQADIGNPSARTSLQSLEAMLGNPDAAGKTLYGVIGDFVGQTNLKTLLAALGIPDVAAKSLYTCLVTDRLDQGTYGLSALQTILANVTADSQIRTISAGTKTLATATTKYLSFDSLTNGAEIVSIIVKGLIGASWTLDVYVPTDDAVASPAAGDKRDTITYLSTDTEGGLLQGFGIIYNGFLNFTNNGGGNQTISDVVIVYRSRIALTVGWQT